jgi:hypothetical protein
MPTNLILDASDRSLVPPVNCCWGVGISVPERRRAAVQAAAKTHTEHQLRQAADIIEFNMVRHMG